MDQSVIEKMLSTIAGITGKVEGAFNLRQNGQGVERYSTENVKITAKADRPGIDILVRPGTKGESVHIPVILTESGINDLVYNDFIIGEGADVTIIAGCGIHNDGHAKSEHDGIHSFKIGKNAHIRYVEKHYGEGEGTGERILNPTTLITMDEGASCEMEMVQIAGVSSTVRKTDATLGKDAKLLITERLMTHDKQSAVSDVVIHLNGEGSSAQVISRSVAKDQSEQVFHPIAQGNAPCHAHIQCDTILMDGAHVRSIPEIEANHSEAAIIHEAAIGRINNEQMLKLETLGLDEQEAEKIIIDAFLE
ncbi:MAG TPA: SufD family Fe-S cluster assembly protein [Candidatus Faecivivens stercoripullorum]|uniref:SufD family Fe-S cluster assembly protein n=1 Tax=Candidatus Faecivivens stercoripullorum TaxID=2840805 RepID=A0A9D1KRX9_9FIRM|nr:SufD family Fe-S cluster assembly protein [Candidatus Faecivivens stercoripullorum]